jgi:hypothetical protein
MEQVHNPVFPLHCRFPQVLMRILLWILVNHDLKAISRSIRLFVYNNNIEYIINLSSFIMQNIWSIMSYKRAITNNPCLFAINWITLSVIRNFRNKIGRFDNRISFPFFIIGIGKIK